MISDMSNVALNKTDLHAGIVKALSEAGIRTVGDVKRLDVKDMIGIKGIGPISAKKIRAYISDAEMLGESIERRCAPDSVWDAGFSPRTRNALYHSKYHTLSAIREATDYQLREVRNLGAKGFAEIYALIPDRIREYEGDEEGRKAMYAKRKFESDARRVIRFMEDGKNFSSGYYSVYRARKARNMLKVYCADHPECVDDLIGIFEAQGETSDRLYKYLINEKAKGGFVEKNT